MLLSGKYAFCSLEFIGMPIIVTHAFVKRYYNDNGKG